MLKISQGTHITVTRGDNMSDQVCSITCVILLVLLFNSTEYQVSLCHRALDRLSPLKLQCLLVWNLVWVIQVMMFLKQNSNPIIKHVGHIENVIWDIMILSPWTFTRPNVLVFNTFLAFLKQQSLWRRNCVWMIPKRISSINLIL